MGVAGWGWDGLRNVAGNDVLKPVVARYQGKVSRIYFRADAAFAMPEVYEFLEAERIKYAIRLPANQVLQSRIGYLLTRPVGRPPHHVRRFHANFSYQAGTWNGPAREEKTGLSSSRLQLVCEINQVLRYHINRLLRNGCGSPRSKFVRSCDTGNAQASSLCSNDIVSMRGRRYHHAFAGRQIERFSSGEIDSRFWFVVASNLRAENGVEAKLVAPSEISHQRDVGIGNWRQQKITGQASKPGIYVRPSIQSIPRKV
jgi:Transposase DDE domain group 1